MSWKDYERKIGDYFRKKGYNVEENKKIKGKSGVEHEIDILAEDYFGLVRIACQCKAWDRKVPKDEILKWNSICEDINAKPAFAALSGYDKNALEVAKNFKFILFEGLELIYPKTILIEEVEKDLIDEGKKYYNMAFSEEDETKANGYAKKAVEILKKVADQSIDACLMLAELYIYFVIEDEDNLAEQFEIGHEYLRQAITKFLNPIRSKMKDISSVIHAYFEELLYPRIEDPHLLDVAKSFLTLYTFPPSPDAEAFEMLGDFYRYGEDWQKAESYYKLALKILGLAKSKNEASKVRILTKIAEVKEEMGKLDEAEEYYNKALEIDPKDYRAIRELAELKEKKKEFDDAIKLYKQLSKLYPENHHPTWDLARIHFMKSTGLKHFPYSLYKDELKKAIEYLTEAHKRCPKGFKILEDLALCYFLLGDYDKAREYKEKAEELRQKRKED